MKQQCLNIHPLFCQPSIVLAVCVIIKACKHAQHIRWNITPNAASFEFSRSSTTESPLVLFFEEVACVIPATFTLERNGEFVNLNWTGDCFLAPLGFSYDLTENICLPKRGTRKNKQKTHSCCLDIHSGILFQAWHSCNSPAHLSYVAGL